MFQSLCRLTDVCPIFSVVIPKQTLGVAFPLIISKQTQEIVFKIVSKPDPTKRHFFDMEWSCSATTVFVQILVSFHSVCFCVLSVLSAALPHTMRLVRRLQYQFARSWTRLCNKTRPRVGQELNSPPTSTEHRTHLSLDHRLVTKRLWLRRLTQLLIKPRFSEGKLPSTKCCATPLSSITGAIASLQ